MFHLSVKPISRSDGRSATAAAAYRAGEQIADLRTGELHDYSRKRDVVHSEILVPPGSPAWAEDRSALWNAAEAAEKRKDARVARDYEVAIPKELTLAQGIELVRDFSQDLVDRHGVAVDFNIHRDDLRKWDGSEKGWQGYHAHILTSTRKLGREGFGDKADPELSNAKRKSLGLCEGPAEIAEVRERWEMYANRHLERANQTQRIDRRSLKDQGIDRDPTVHLGPHVTGLERRGIPSRLGDINRQVVADQEVSLDHRRTVEALTVEIGQIYVDIVEQGGRRSGSRVERERDERAQHRPERLDPHEREAVRAGLRVLVHQRDLRVQRVLERAQKRQERRVRAYQAIAKAEPAPSKGLLDTLQQKGHQQARAAWDAATKAAARLVEQAKRLTEQLVHAAGARRLVAWAREALKRQPELVARREEHLLERAARNGPAHPEKSPQLEAGSAEPVPFWEEPGFDPRTFVGTPGRAALQPEPSSQQEPAAKDIKTQAAEGVAAFRARREQSRQAKPEPSYGDKELERLKAEADLEQRAAEQERSNQHDRRGPSWGRSIKIERDGPNLERSRGRDGPEIGD